MTHFNQISDDAYNQPAPGDSNTKVKTDNRLAHLLINASKTPHQKLTYKGLDISAGLEVMACGLNDGSSEVNFSKGFTGHHASIDRMNSALYHYDPEFQLMKVGELKTFGFGTSRRPLIKNNPDGTQLLGPYERRGRNVYCPGRVTEDSVVYKPYLLWNQRYQTLCELLYVQSDHCRAEDWIYQNRQMQGIFLLWLIQNDIRSGDTRCHAVRRLAQTFANDAEKGFYTYHESVKQAVKTAGLEAAFSEN